MKSALFQAKVMRALAAADQSFADTGDVLEALRWVGFAATAELPLPPRIGAWLKAGIGSFISSETPSLDAALGLLGTGKASPRRKQAERNKLEYALAQIAVLRAVGATIHEAAALVASLSADFAISTLESRSKGKTRLERSRPWHCREVAKLLDEYPDRVVKGIDIGKIKRDIRARYAKPRP